MRLERDACRPVMNREDDPRSRMPSPGDCPHHRWHAAAVFFLVGLTVLTSSVSPAPATWRQNEFVIGAFWDPCIEGDRSGRAFSRDSIRFARAKQAHFNLLTGFQNYEWIDHGPDGMAYACSLAATVDLRYLVTDYRYLRGPTMPPFDPDTATAVTDFYRGLDPIGRRAQAGYFLGDEPHPEELSRVRDWTSHIRQREDSLLVMVNLLPVYGQSFPLRSDYETYLDGFLGDGSAASDQAVACFDHYPFLADSTRTDYFYNLSVVGEKAGPRPMWVIVRSTEFPPYAEQTPWHLRYSVFCPIAYGAKGIIYYTYEQNGGTAPENPYGPAPVVDCDTYTWRYYYLRIINRYLRDVLGPVVMNSDHLGAFHSARDWNGEAIPLPEQLDGDRALPVVAVDNPDLLVSVYRDRRDPAVVRLIVVNKARDPGSTSMTLRGNHVGRVWATPGLAYFRTGSRETPLQGIYDPLTDTTRIRFHLMAGEGRLLRIAE